MADINKGIQGNFINFGAVAVGDHARAVQHGNQEAKIAEALAALQQVNRQVETQSATIPNVNLILGQLEELRKELNKPKEERSGLKSTIESVSHGLQSVSGLTTAVGTLVKAVFALL